MDRGPILCLLIYCMGPVVVPFSPAGQLRELNPFRGHGIRRRVPPGIVQVVFQRTSSVLEWYPLKRTKPK